MVGGIPLGALGDAVDTASDYIEYWREHKGEEVVIRKHQINSEAQGRHGISQTSYITRGTISRVLSLPPGFVLEDVKEVIVLSDLEMLFGPDATEVEKVKPTSEGEQIVRTVDEKFVAFSAIEELEKAEHADNSREPFRE